MMMMMAATVPIIGVGQSFDSFDDLKQKIEEHGSKHHVQWVRSDSKTVQSANMHISGSAKKYEERFVYRYVRYRCKHGGKVKPYQKKTPGVSRPNQKTFKMQCPAEVYASVDRNTEKMVIHTVNETHNHIVGEDVFVHYPEQRRLDEDTLTSVKQMLSMKVKVKYLQEFVHSKGKKLTIRDIHNIRMKMRRDANGTKTQEELLLDVLSEIGKDDPGATIAVQVDDAEIDYLTIVTSKMKESFDLYPDVLMIDGTYRVNKLNMPMYVLLVEDGEGHGRIAGFSLVSNEKKFTIESLPSEINKIHQLDKVSTVVIDKDRNELSAIKKVLPNANIQLCKFHVMQAVQREVRKEAIATAEKATIIQEVRQMAYSRTEDSYCKHLLRLSNVAPQKFKDYFEKNWAKCTDYWAGYKTNCYINLGNTTNNRLESLNQKIKDVLHRHMTLHEALRGMMLLLNSMTHHETHRSFSNTMKSSYRLGEKDSSINDAVSQLTLYAAKIVVQEIEAAKTNPKTALMTSNCCSLNLTMGLPCRHLFAGRLQANDEPIFVLEDVKPRWRKDYEEFVGTRKRKTSVDVGPTIKKVKQLKVVPKSKEEKYSKMMMLFKSMADLASNDGMPQFALKMKEVERMKETWFTGFSGSTSNVDEVIESNKDFGDGVIDFEDYLGKQETGIDGSEEPNQTADETINVTTTKGQGTDDKIKLKDVKIMGHENVKDDEDYTVDFEDYLENADMYSDDRQETEVSKTADETNDVTATEKQKGDQTIIEDVQKPNQTANETNDVTATEKQKVDSTNMEDVEKTGHENITADTDEQLEVFSIFSGTPHQVLKNLSNINLPKAPPVRGKSRVKKNDNHISAAMCLLKHQFPDIGGLQDPILGQKLQFNICKGKFVQCLHDGGLHWLTVSSKGRDQIGIDVYDSLYKKPSIDVKMQVASITMQEKRKVTLNYRKLKIGKFKL